MIAHQKDTLTRLLVLTAALTLAASGAMARAQATDGDSAATTQAKVAGPPPSTGGFYPLSKVHRGLMATAWTVFEGTKPEPMQVEILGVLRGARGPGQDMILAKLLGAKPEYTGVVAGMSGSPVYVGDKLMGALAYRIGQFSKEPIAGITPIAQMLEVRDLPILTGAISTGTIAAGPDAASAKADGDAGGAMSAGGMTFQAMETPLVMSGFRPAAIQLWQKKMAGTGLDMVAAGGMGESGEAGAEISAKAMASVVPGSAVSAQLIRGDLEISATCTVTYVDPKQLLACGHPILQAGHVSLPMTTAEVVTTLASPLNAFKIVNTGATIGAFTQDRDSAIRGVLGTKARMIPVHLAIYSQAGAGREEAARRLNFDVLDLPTLTPQALMVALYNSLLQTNQSAAETSYHVMGSIRLEGYAPVPVDLWAASAAGAPSQLLAALQFGQRFSQIYSNDSRQGAVRAIDLRVETIPHNARVTLDTARIVSGEEVHAGDTVMVEATLQPWQQAARNVRIPIRLPAGLGEGNVRVLVSDAGTLDRALQQPRLTGRTPDLDTVLAEARRQHAPDQVYVSLLTPDAQAEMDGQTLSSVPLSVANAMEPLRTARDASLNGESAVVAGEAPAGGLLTGFQILTVHVDGGGGLH
ncbi:MAG TPA: hypothetical protein VMV57_07005 [Terracidiphilus sp.]|nr:hypothetical protein [Terracidiphilus sp.]